MKQKLIYIEDNKLDQLSFLTFIESNNIEFECKFADSIKEAKKILKKENFDIALIDFKLGDGTAFNIIDILKKTPFIILTGAGDENIAIQAMKKGAYDYIIKDTIGSYLKNLPSIIENTIKRKKLEEEVKNYQDNLEKMVIARTDALRNEIDEHEKDTEKTFKDEKLFDEKVNESDLFDGIVHNIAYNDNIDDNILTQFSKNMVLFFDNPENTSLKMEIQGKIYNANNISEGDKKIRADIIDNNIIIGNIEVSRFAASNEIDKDIFREEEILFLDNVATKIVMFARIIRTLNEKSFIINNLRDEFRKIKEEIEKLNSEISVLSGKNENNDLEEIYREITGIETNIDRIINLSC